jgi:hypothetical protein
MHRFFRCLLDTAAHFHQASGQVPAPLAVIVQFFISVFPVRIGQRSEKCKGTETFTNFPCFEELFGWLKAPPAGSFMFKVLRREGFFNIPKLYLFPVLILIKHGCGSGITDPDPDQQILAADPNSPKSHLDRDPDLCESGSSILL